jgi:hypothetical protein
VIERSCAAVHAIGGNKTAKLMPRSARRSIVSCFLCRQPTRARAGNAGHWDVALSGMVDWRMRAEFLYFSALLWLVAADKFYRTENTECLRQRRT